MKYDSTNFENSTRDNAGGICMFEFVPKEWVAEDMLYSLEENTLLAPIVLVSGKSWLSAKPMQDTTSYVEEQVESDAGIAWQQRMALEVYRDNSDINAILNNMAYREFVVIYYDNNGYKKIIGTKDKGASPLAKLSVSAQYVGKNGYAMELQHQSDMPAPFYPF